MDNGNWTETGTAVISGGNATATGPAASFMLATSTHPTFAYVLHECFVSLAIDPTAAGTGAAYVEWAAGTSNDFQVKVLADKSMRILQSTQLQPGTFEGVLRLREHKGCLHVETVDPSANAGATWKEVSQTPTPSQLGSYQSGLKFGILGATASDHAVFTNYNLPPIP